MNLNDFAKKVTLKEGKKLSLSIAQVKEVIKIVMNLLTKLPKAELEDMLKRYKSLKK